MVAILFIFTNRLQFGVTRFVNFHFYPNRGAKHIGSHATINDQEEVYSSSMEPFISTLIDGYNVTG